MTPHPRDYSTDYRVLVVRAGAPPVVPAEKQIAQWRAEIRECEG